MNNTSDDYNFDNLPQPVRQLDEVKSALAKHKISCNEWVSRKDDNDVRLYLNGYKGKYKATISRVFGVPYDPPGYQYLFDNLFIEFNLEPIEREERRKEKEYKLNNPNGPEYQRQSPSYSVDEIKELTGKFIGVKYTAEEIQELKTAKFQLCEKLNDWGLVDPLTLYANEKIVSLWKPKIEVIVMTRKEDRTI